MPEAGGPTTESGILYQNSVAALFMGRMCDAARRTDRDRVYSVRVEAPEDVDDTVVVFADGHRGFIQAKEAISAGHNAWNKLWRDFDSQFRRPEFRRGRDRLILYTGENREEIHDLKEVCLRASGAMSYGEWQNALNQRQKAFVEKIKPLLGPETLEDSTLLAFFWHISVEVWPLVEIERDKLPYWMPPSVGDTPPIALFRLLRDRVGGEARRRGTFTSDSLRESLSQEGHHLAIPPDIESLREAVRRCGAPLLQHKSTFARTGRHIRRNEVDSIIAWAYGDADRKPVAMLLDRAGMGKSVVIRDVLVGLEAAGAVALAIKADSQLSGVDSHDALQASLGLPEPVERVVGRLAALGPVVVLIDQIDALSLSMARDQKALDVVLEAVARLRLIPGVRILISCRAFDRNGDPRLQNIEVGREFVLAELPEAEVESVLLHLGVEYGGLSPAAKKLVRVPLHLDLLARAVEGRGAGMPRDPEVYRGIGSLQDLYALFWEHVVLKPDPGAPPAHQRLEVLDRMTDAMFRDQRTSVPRSMFATEATSALEPAVRWLASMGVLVAGPADLGFLHQTFFDYCYARRFVEGGRALTETVLDSDQGLHVRPLLVQVLHYLRGTDQRRYLSELRKLFAAERLRPHLRDLLTRWFGSLPEPTDGEWSLANRRLFDPATRASFLAVMAGNSGWFARIVGEPLETLLALEDQEVDSQVIPYLISLLGEQQTRVVEIAGELSRRGGACEARAARIASFNLDLSLPGTAELFEQLAGSQEGFLGAQVHRLDAIAKAHPRIGCVLVRRLLDRVLQQYSSAREREEEGLCLSLNHELERLNGSTLDRTVKFLGEADPANFTETILTWLEAAIRLTGRASGSGEYYGFDDFSTGWHDPVYAVRYGLFRAFVSALATFARRDIDGFRRAASRLASLPYYSAQTLLALVYQIEPELLASDAIAFLLADRRRLNLGDHDQFESRRLITAIHPFLDRDARARLEGFILDNPRPRVNLGVHDLRLRGRDQLFLLQAIPVEHLTDRGSSYLGELERKFPGVRASENPTTEVGGFVDSPISLEAIRLMSDPVCANAMRTYRPGVRHRDPLSGGHRELGLTLLAAVKLDPERFDRLICGMSDADVEPYAWAILDGMAESDSPPERIFNIARRFANYRDSETRRSISRALLKRVSSGLPDDLMNVLEGWVRDVALDESREADRDLDSDYLNSDRGAALGALMRAIDQQNSPTAKELRWRLIEFIATDASMSLRAGAIRELLFLLQEGRDRAVGLFERLMYGHPSLVRSRWTQDFLYYGFYKHFARTEPHIRTLMDEPAEGHARRGAELACIAALSPLAIESPEAHDSALRLAELALSGRASWRRGAARVYAANPNRARPEECLLALSRLLDDEDEGVRQQIADLFDNFNSTDLISQSIFLTAFASSRCLVEGIRPFAKYLWEHWRSAPEIALSLIAATLDGGQELGGPHRHFDGEELVRVTLGVYADPASDDEIRREAMDLFDRLMGRYAGRANQILEEWDRV